MMASRGMGAIRKGVVKKRRDNTDFLQDGKRHARRDNTDLPSTPKAEKFGTSLDPKGLVPPKPCHLQRRQVPRLLQKPLVGPTPILLTTCVPQSKP